MPVLLQIDQYLDERVLVGDLARSLEGLDLPPRRPAEVIEARLLGEVLGKGRLRQAFARPAAERLVLPLSFALRPLEREGQEDEQLVGPEHFAGRLKFPP